MPWFRKYFKMDKAGGDGGSGGGQGVQGGGTLLAGQRDENSPGGGGGQGGDPGNPPAPDNKGGAGNAGGSFPENWKELLPEDIRNDANLGVIKDPVQLAKSFIHAQKQIGADKVALPGKNATQEDWDNFYQKIGRPEKADDYGLKPGEKSTIDEEFMKPFAEAAHKAGLTPAQAQKLVSWFDEANGQKLQASTEAQEAKFKEDLTALKKEWGGAFNQNLNVGEMALNEYAPDGFMEWAQEKGLTDDIMFTKFLHSVGAKTLAEDKIKGDGAPGGKARLSPAEAKMKLDAIHADSNHPYYKGDKAAKQEVRELYEQMNTKA